jgi:hypothetical protein
MANRIVDRTRSIETHIMQQIARHSSCVHDGILDLTLYKMSPSWSLAWMGTRQPLPIFRVCQSDILLSFTHWQQPRRVREVIQIMQVRAKLHLASMVEDRCATARIDLNLPRQDRRLHRPDCGFACRQLLFPNNNESRTAFPGNSVVGGIREAALNRTPSALASRQPEDKAFREQNTQYDA